MKDSNSGLTFGILWLLWGCTQKTLKEQETQGPPSALAALTVYHGPGGGEAKVVVLAEPKSGRALLPSPGEGEECNTAKYGVARS